MIPNLDRLRQFMAKSHIDAVIATSPENVTYLAEYYCASQWLTKGTQVYAVVTIDDSVQPFLVLPNLEIDAWAEAPSWITDLRPYGNFFRDFEAMDTSMREDDRIIARFARSATIQASAVETLIKTLETKSLAGAKLALDETGLLPNLWRAITDGLTHARIIDGSDLLRNTRMVKTSAEIELLTRAACINEKALNIAIDAAKPGTTERELVNLFTSEVARLGAIPGFWITNAGRRAGHIHSLVSDYVLQAGDLVKWDVGCTYRQYWSDMARTKAVTTATDEQWLAYEALLAGEQAAIRSIRPGVNVATVFQMAVETVRASGLPSYQRTHCGHGIGIAVYDLPLIQSSTSVSDIALMGCTDMVLEAGMVLCIETPYYNLGRWGMTVEDTVVIEESGAMLLTSMNRELVR